MKILFAVAAMLVCSVVQATTVCEGFASLANSVMSMRQHGVPAVDAIAVCNASGSDTLTADICRGYVKQTYASQRYLADENRQQAITDFESSKYMACLAARGDTQ